MEDVLREYIQIKRLGMNPSKIQNSHTTLARAWTKTGNSIRRALFNYEKGYKNEGNEQRQRRANSKNSQDKIRTTANQ